MPFIDTLKTLRNKASLRKAELARNAGVHADTIGRMESHISVTEESCVKVVNALNREPAFDGTAPSRPPIVLEDVMSERSSFGEGKVSPKKRKVAEEEGTEVGS